LSAIRQVSDQTEATGECGMSAFARRFGVSCERSPGASCQALH
jgi:hypothetical protein